MKNLSLFVSAFALVSSSAYADPINCGTLPSCTSLGYSDTVTHCPKNVNGEEMVVKCPFDTTQGKCIREAAVGQIAYFSKAPNAASGWLKCDGQTITKTKYPELYAFLGQQFCNTYNGGTCGTDVGRLPKYTGLFLRVFGSPTGYGNVGNTDLTTPQQEGLPNITGTLNVDDIQSGQVGGAFYTTGARSEFDQDSRWKSGMGAQWGMDASRSNSIYGAQNGVTPPNMAVYAYIYAGKIVK